MRVSSPRADEDPGAFCAVRGHSLFYRLAMHVSAAAFRCGAFLNNFHRWGIFPASIGPGVVRTVAASPAGRGIGVEEFPRVMLWRLPNSSASAVKQRCFENCPIVFGRWTTHRTRAWRRLRPPSMTAIVVAESAGRAAAKLYGPRRLISDVGGIKSLTS